jgi:hypothetical protein
MYLGGIRLLVLLAEWEIIALLPLMGNLAFLLFDEGMRTLLVSGTEGRAGPTSFVLAGGKLSGTSRIAKHGA